MKLRTSTQTRRIALAALTVLTLAAVGQSRIALAQDAHQHAPHEAHEGTSALVLNHGKKWKSDKHLRAAMQKIQALVATERPMLKEQSIDATKAKAIASGVNGQITDMITNCKLDPDADAVLHGLIADLVKANDNLSGPAPTGQGIGLIQQVLVKYPQYFSHPGWKK
jgi:hypothetical protein